MRLKYSERLLCHLKYGQKEITNYFNSLACKFVNPKCTNFTSTIISKSKNYRCNGVLIQLDIQFKYCIIRIWNLIFALVFVVSSGPRFFFLENYWNRTTTRRKNGGLQIHGWMHWKLFLLGASYEGFKNFSVMQMGVNCCMWNKQKWIIHFFFSSHSKKFFPEEERKNYNFSVLHGQKLLYCISYTCRTYFVNQHINYR